MPFEFLKTSGLICKFRGRHRHVSLAKRCEFRCHDCGNIIKLRDHEWNECLCQLCGNVRNLDHAWDGCVCTRCGSTRHRIVWDEETCVNCLGSGDFITYSHAHEGERCQACEGSGHFVTQVRCEDCHQRFPEPTRNIEKWLLV